jgi:single-stranded DNA-binding protein
MNRRIDVETWDAPGNELATMAANSLRKGLRVAVQGRLRIDKWDDRKTGEKRSRAKVRNRWLSAWVRRKRG